MHIDWYLWLILGFYGFLMLAVLSAIVFFVLRGKVRGKLANEISQVQIEMALTLMQVTYAEQRGEDVTVLMTKFTQLQEEHDALIKRAVKVLKRRG